MASDNRPAIKALMRQMNILPEVYTNHFGKEPVEGMTTLQLAQALHKAGVTLNRRGGNGASGGVNVVTRKKPRNAIRSAIRSAIDNAIEEGHATKTLNGTGVTAQVTVNVDNGLMSITVNAGGASEDFTDQYQAYARLYELLDV